MSKSSSWAVLPISSAAFFGSWTPASWMTIWSEPCLRISGSDTPSLSIRLRMMSIDRLRSSVVSWWPLGGFALRTTSSPPCRSSPRVSFLYAGEPGIASSATPARAARMNASSVRCRRRSDTGLRKVSRGSLLERFRLLGLFVLGENAGDGPLRHADLDTFGDLHSGLVVLECLDRGVEAAGGHDLLPDRQRGEQLLAFDLAPALRPDQQEPHDDEEDENEDVAAHRPSSRSRDGEPVERLGLERREPSLLDRRACIRGQFEQES